MQMTLTIGKGNTDIKGESAPVLLCRFSGASFFGLEDYRGIMKNLIGRNIIQPLPTFASFQGHGWNSENLNNRLMKRYFIIYDVFEKQYLQSWDLYIDPATMSWTDELYQAGFIADELELEKIMNAMDTDHIIEVKIIWSKQ